MTIASKIIEHPDEILTAAYLDGTLDQESRDAVEAHLAECGSCRAGVVLLRSPGRAPVERVPSEFVSKALASARSAETKESWRGQAIAGLAAAVVMAAALSIWFSTTTPPSGREIVAYRGSGAASFAPLSPVAGARVPGNEVVFDWPKVKGADRYVVIVLGGGGDVVTTIEAGASGPPVKWPADGPRPPRGTLLYKVRAMALDRVVAESRPISFEVR